MSSGRQLRDFVSVSKVARYLIELSVNPHAHGIYNCGSGIPVSLRELAANTVEKSNSSIVLKFGAYPDRQDEPTAFWADITKISLLV